MKRFIVLLVLIASPAFAKSPVTLRSVQPLQNGGVNICTTFSINEQKGYWLTANHCFVDTATFDGKPVQWVAYNEKWDLAVFEGHKATALHLAIKEPEVGDEVAITGYPHGSLDPMTFFGRVAAPFARLTDVMSGMIFNVLSLPGDSGAPIVDRSGRVVGIGQASNLSGVSWGTPWKVLVEQTARFWETN